MNNDALEVFDFWFKETQSKQWFKKDNEFDTLIINRFSKKHDLAINGKFDAWKKNPYESLAYIILIDQFSRNMFREDPRSYKYDYMSLNVSKKGIKSMFLNEFNSLDHKFFYILPLIHSENIKDQTQAIELANTELKDHKNFNEIKKFFDRHKEIIQKFKRFPHRNKILNRESSYKEIEFLKTPFSSF